MPLHSEVEKFYEDEARQMHVGLPTLVYQLLEDRFLSLTGKGRNMWLPHAPDIPVTTQADPTEEIQNSNLVKDQEPITKEQLPNDDKGSAIWGE